MCTGYYRYVRSDGITTEFALSESELLQSQDNDIKNMINKYGGTYEEHAKLLTIEYRNPSEMDDEDIQDDILLLDTMANGFCIGNNPEHVEHTILKLLNTPDEEIED